MSRHPRRRGCLPVDGVLLLDKPAGLTSNAALQVAKRLLNACKAGHTGSLDPIATGVLPLTFGEATKVSQFLLNADKRYWARIKLGVSTRTYDSEGEVTQTRPVQVSARDAETALARFRGEIEQIPPMYSAIKQGGRALYELAREGVEVEREPRAVTIHSILLERLSLPDFVIRVRCGKGTYIRALAADIGARLGSGGTLAALVRTRVGPYALEQAVPWSLLREARSGAQFWARVLPPDSALGHLPAVSVEDEEARRFSHGQAVPAPGCPDGAARVYAPGGLFLGVGRAGRDLVKPERLLHADPARPSVLPA